MELLHWLTIFHAALNLVAVTAGILVVKGLVAAAGRQLWTLLFLVSAAATTFTGFFFPFTGVTLAFILAVISALAIALAIVARYRHRLAGKWRGVYVISAVSALYFNCFTLIGQTFQEIPSPNLPAPTPSEPLFQLAQIANLVLFIMLGVIAFKKYRPRLDAEINTTYISPHPEAE